jgi:hypothetical protein
VTVSKRLKRILLISFSTLYLAGLSYWLCHLFMKTRGEFGEESHWLERVLGPTHLIAAMTFIFVTGIVWSQHIGFALKLRRHRFSGWMFIVLMGLLSISGITLLYGSESMIHLAEQYHPWFGAVLLPCLALHWIKRGKKNAKKHVHKAT